MVGRQTKKDTEDKEKGGGNGMKTRVTSRKREEKCFKNDTQRKDRKKEK